VRNWRTVPVDPEALGPSAQASSLDNREGAARAPSVTTRPSMHGRLATPASGLTAVTTSTSASLFVFFARSSTRRFVAADQLAPFYADLA